MIPFLCLLNLQDIHCVFESNNTQPICIYLFSSSNCEHGDNLLCLGKAALPRRCIYIYMCNIYILIRNTGFIKLNVWQCFVLVIHIFMSLILFSAFGTGIMQVFLVFNFHRCTHQSFLDSFQSFSEDFSFILQFYIV